MTVPVPFSGNLRHIPRASAAIALTAITSAAIALGGCSMTLGSLTNSPEPKEEPAQITSSANIASLSETIKNNPDNPQTYNMRGSVLAQAGKTEEALADFNKAISLDPNYGQAFANRGQIFRKTKRLDQAMSDYERALALDANTRRPGLAGAWSIRRAAKRPRRSRTSTRRSHCVPTTPRLITIAACSTRARSSTSSRSRTSPRPTAWCRNSSSRCSAAH
jgi:tetratricopeptide (TPR) repeat protein